MRKTACESSRITQAAMKRRKAPSITSRQREELLGFLSGKPRARAFDNAMLASLCTEGSVATALRSPLSVESVSKLVTMASPEPVPAFVHTGQPVVVDPVTRAPPGAIPPTSAQRGQRQLPPETGFPPIPRNPDLPLIRREYFDRFLFPAREEIGERACIMGNQCQAFCVGMSEDGIALDPELPKSPLREFLFPGPNGEEPSHTEGGPGMCLLCLLQSTAVHVASHIYNQTTPIDVLQRFKVSTGPGEFDKAECWPMELYPPKLTGIPYALPKFNTAKFSWGVQPGDPPRLVILNHFRKGPAA